MDQSLIPRRLLLLVLDGALISLAFWAAFAFRLLDNASPQFELQLHLLPWALFIGLSVLLSSGWYRSLTRYSGSHSLYGLLPRAGLAVLLLLLVSTLLGGVQPPRSFWLLFWLLFASLEIVSRIVMRDLLRWHSQSAGPGASEGTPTLIYGAGEAGIQLVEALRHQPSFQVMAVLDDDPSLWGRRLQRLPIHSPEHLPALIDQFGIRQVLLAIPSATRSRKRQLVRLLTDQGLQVLAMPSLAQLACGDLRVTDLKPVQIDDLLGREPSVPDRALLTASVVRRSVMVTGAGGSIGSELCRQILSLRPTRLVLLERNEFALYSIAQQLEAQLLSAAMEVPIVAVLADVSDRQRLEILIRNHGIQVLFHAAAYKHVPLVEANVCAGLANNVLGTRSALEAAIACGLERFTLISTDKAVRPTNAMGASKRVCELLVQDAAAAIAATGRGPICSMVRFGNVLGSSGSVVPRFRQQISEGGPVTVTHPAITRFFMTIPESVQLVLQASGMASGGEVFVLDMGDPVRIADLARQMIRLSGCTVREPGNTSGDVAIEFTGLRPGEKLYEELLLSDTDAPTAHALIRQAREAFLPRDQLTKRMADLEAAIEAWNAEWALQALNRLVPEYTPAHHQSC
ncbi:polysaccharide biosynthesis protein [Cyanobium sp. ATX 6F1]|uniref:polysaccharide biosynthesis protein n=1 Tax=Cyanobium sp. ATX 6F1 TaxID=2823702 RepID=UPI0020CC5C8B|nr:nucleoside-diphosphate sugar epimerase/dehydratase [Cyanobium sp. ATX 6F1]